MTGQRISTGYGRHSVEAIHPFNSCQVVHINSTVRHPELVSGSMGPQQAMDAETSSA
jgi:hypothetical protein